MGYNVPEAAFHLMLQENDEGAVNVAADTGGIGTCIGGS
jgi:hypothetical protein